MALENYEVIAPQAKVSNMFSLGMAVMVYFP